MRKALVPGIPFAVSLALSAFTVGNHVGWQDSGFFLAAIRDPGVLYPPGFVLYLVLAKAWTLALGFFDFTLAVHLFSSVCAAAAAGSLTLAARDLLRSKGPLLGIGGSDHDPSAVAAGCLAAAGFSFWSAALLAKGYAFYYLIGALLLWRLIRADETGRPRDFTVVAVLIGLLWAAHPSSLGVAVALLLFVAIRGRDLGAKGIAGRVGLAAACAIAPSLLLPVLAARDPAVMFGNPVTVDEWFRYLAGSRFVGQAGVFGLDSFRLTNVAKFFWEDFLGVGLIAGVAGLVRIGKINQRLLVGIAAWVLPSVLLATLFRIEGQQDLWLVAAWLPLHLAVAVGLAWIPRRPVAPIAAAAGLLWAVAANARDVSTRDADLAEAYGRFHLENVARDAILILDSDDTLATAQYLQVVKGLRPDVVVASAPRFMSPWYADHLRRRHPRLKAGSTLREFSAANAAAVPVYFDAAPPDLVAAGAPLMPDGPLVRLAPPGAPPPSPWTFPVTMDQVRARRGRPRGVHLTLRSDGLQVRAEAYEERWISAYVRTQANVGQGYLKAGADADLRKAAEFFEAARAADPDHPDRGVIHGLGVAHFLLKQYALAEPRLRQLLELDPTPRQAVRACSFLATICASQGRGAEAQRFQERGMAIVRSDPELRAEFERRQSPR